jgi:hypothetical protein
MTWILSLSGSKWFLIPNIIVGAYIYCMLKKKKLKKKIKKKKLKKK